MRHTLLLCSAIGILASAHAPALELTPRFVTRVSGNENIAIPFFADGQDRYTIEIPKAVSVSDADGGALFRFKKIENASMTLKASPFQPSQAFEGASLETYRKAALGTLPFGASNVSITKETADPQTGWTGYRFVIAYQLPGRSFVQIVTYLNFSDTQQILALTTTPANGYEAAEAMTSNLLGAWRKLRPGESIAVPPPL